MWLCLSLQMSFLMVCTFEFLEQRSKTQLYSLTSMSYCISKGSRQFNLKLNCFIFWKYTAAFSLCNTCLWLVMNMCVMCGSFRLRCCLMCGTFTGWTRSSICYRRTDSLINPPHLSHRLTTCIHMHTRTPAEIKLHSLLSPLKMEIMIFKK